MLGVNLTSQTDSRSGAQDHRDEFGIEYPIALDTEGSVRELYLLRGQPHTFVLDAEGAIHNHFTGAVMKETLEEAVAALEEGNE